MSNKSNMHCAKCRQQNNSRSRPSAIAGFQKLLNCYWWAGPQPKGGSIGQLPPPKFSQTYAFVRCSNKLHHFAPPRKYQLVAALLMRFCSRPREGLRLLGKWRMFWLYSHVFGPKCFANRIVLTNRISACLAAKCICWNTNLQSVLNEYPIDSKKVKSLSSTNKQRRTLFWRDFLQMKNIFTHNG